MDLNTAALTGLKLAGFERPLPMWDGQKEKISASSGNGSNAKSHRKQMVEQ